MNSLQLPEVARVLLKGMVVALANAGLVSQADADAVIAALGLHDA